MKKRLLSALLTFCMALALLPGTAWAADIVQSGQCGSNAAWTQDSDGTLTISGTGPMQNYDVIMNFSPWFMSSVKSIKIEEGITSIGYAAFGWMFSLKTLEIPKSVVYIAGDAFNNSRMITDIYYAGTEADWNNIQIASGNYTLDSATIHFGSETSGPSGKSGTCGPGLNWTLSSDGTLIISGTGEMDDFAGGGAGTAPWYADRNNIKTVIIENGVTSTGYCAFWECTNITKIELPDTLTKIGAYSFALCTSLPEIIIPSRVTQISSSAFGACYALTRVTIPDGITNIEDQTFAECTGLRKITIPGSVTRIGDTAFWKCSSLTDVYYGGSEQEWAEVQIGNDNDPLHSARIHYSPDSPTISDTDTSLKRQSLNFGSRLIGSDSIAYTTIDVDWGWRLFDESASGSPADFPSRIPLAVTGLALSAAAERAQSSAESMLRQLGYTEVESYNYGPNLGEWFYPAVTFGHKAIVKDGEIQRHMFAVVVRGTDPDEIEDILTDINVHGFSRSAQNLCNQMETFMRSICGLDPDAVKGNSKFFVTGHSLGGATANLIAVQLNQTYGKDNVYAYTFAAPMNTFGVSDEELRSASNIYNVLNLEDYFATNTHPLKSDRYGTDMWFRRDIFEPYGFYDNFKKLTGRAFKPDDSAHDVAVYMSYLLTWNTARKFTITITVMGIFCPVDVEIYDSSDTLVGKVTDDIADNTLSDKVFIRVNGDRKYVYLLQDDAYTVRLNGTGDGEMMYTVQNLSIETGETTGKTFSNVQLTDGKCFASEVKTANDTETGTDVEDVRLFVVNGGVPEKEVLPDGKGTEIPAELDISNPFTDVKDTAWYYSEVMYAYRSGLMTGTSAATFEPLTATTRGMVVTMLHRMEGAPAAGASAFPDVAAGQWYTDGAAWAAANRVVNGYDNGNFGPGDTITREQLAAILCRYAQFKGYDTSASDSLTAFTDANSVSGYAADAMRWAVASGLISGKGNGILDPGGGATRAEVAAIFMRFCENIAK